jgi:hypothetical protein
MDSVESQKPEIFVYPRHTIERAVRALICSPFRRRLFTVMRHQSIPLSAIAQSKGYQAEYTQRVLSELTCETALSWLINVGFLRREVDGQGITDSYRLTPLGHQVLAEFTGVDFPAPQMSDRLKDTLTRWLRLPF